MNDLVSGVVAGGANIVAGYPFDTVKVRMQASSVNTPAWKVFTSILRNEGPKALYRGLSAPLIGGAAETGINYYVYQQCLNYLSAEMDMRAYSAVPLSALASALCLSLILTPAEAVKCRMQMGKSCTSTMECLKALARERNGLIRGLEGTLLRESIGNPLYFSTYAALRHALPGKHIPVPGEKLTMNEWLQNVGSAVISGGTAGCLMWAAILPIDTAKTRTQIAYPGDPTDMNVIKQLHMTWKEGRLQSLYSGLRPTLLRAFPANAAQWVTWEMAISWLTVENE